MTPDQPVTVPSQPDAYDRESVSLQVDSGAVGGHVFCVGIGEAEQVSQAP